MGPKPTSRKVSSRSSRKANAAGFAKRQSRLAKATKTANDVYEYSSGKNRRSAITLSLDKDEEYGEEPIGPGLNGNSDVQFDYNALRSRIMDAGEGGDVIIDSKDDEEIDSDGAFEESDNEQFAGFSFAKKTLRKSKPRASASTTKVRFAEVDLDEAEDKRQSEEDLQGDADSEELDGDSDEFLDVLDVLDGRGEPDFGDEPGGEIDEEKDAENESGQDIRDGEDDDDEEDDDDDEEEEGYEEMTDTFAPSDTEHQPDEAALDDLDAFVSKLEYGTKRKAEDDAGEAAVSAGLPLNRKRRMLRERTEGGVESEFGVQAASGSKLQLDDLLAPLASSSLQALRTATKPLTKGDALPAPLPQRTQDRLDREAAYEQTKGEVDKWKATMKRIKEADHLSFPLQVPQKIHPSNSQLAAKFKPSTELESAVDKLLRAAQMRDEGDITRTEELKMNHLSVEEVAARRAELRRMRELMFRADAKAKRVAKIKSKTYRKIQRKSREKVNGLIKEAEGLDSADEDEDEVRMKHEVERAKERATLRHKNTGKWAKAMKGKGELDVDQRREIEEMLERGEALRAKIHGDNGSESDDADDAEDGIESIKARAFEELRDLERDGDTDTPKEKRRGVFGMKFMQDAMAREAKRIGEAADDFRDEMARMADGEDIATEAGDIEMRRVGGRMTFRPGQATVAPWPIATSDSSSTLKSSEPALLSPAVASLQPVRSSPPVPPQVSDIVSPPPEEHQVPVAEVNPWLQARNSSAIAQSRRRNEILIGKNSALAEKSKHQTKKLLKKGEEEREKARDDAVVEISMDDVLVLPDIQSSRDDHGTSDTSRREKEKEKTPANGQQVDAAFEESDADSEVEEQERKAEAKGSGKGVKAFEQRDLVALAFAGDNVVQDFESLKKREIEADAPREEDRTLPGWGSWGGAGVRPNPKAKKIIRKVAGIDPKSRADHGKPHLIISEKKDKKAAKYLTKDLPYPYTSRAQFEKSMEIPVGMEWNTRVGFQRQTLPRVVKKMGTVINPLEKLF